MRCNCPYIICKFHGDCAACIEHNRKTDDLAHCMEKTAQARGAVMPLRIPKTLLEPDFEAMSLRCAELICETLKEKPDAVFSLAAGSTAVRTYEILKELQEAGKVDFSNARFVALDEWLDLADESENCDAFMRRNFYTPLGIREEQITRFDIHAPDLDAACKAVDNKIIDLGGIDLMLLGVGMNGHLGLNEPGTDFGLTSHVVELDSVTAQVGQKYFSEGMELSRGITLGVRHMFECGHVILQAGGSHKSEIVERLYRTAPTEELPATVLKLVPHGTVVLDRDAAANILDLLQ